MKSETNDSKKKLNEQLIKESLVDYNNLAQKVKENATESLKSMLGETVKEAFAALMNESDDEEKKDKETGEKGYDIEEVEDTTDTTEEETEEGQEEQVLNDEESGEDDAEGTEQETEAVEDTTEETDGEGEIEADFEEFKVGDDTYDFRNADDEQIVKIYKRLNGDDQLTVVKSDNKIEVSDKETGAEYIIELDDEVEDEAGITDTNETQEMKESRIYEIVLNEYDSHVGYTDNYQSKDVMTNDGVSEPGKGRDIDAGVPKTAKKPWSSKKDGKPFTDKAKTNECGTTEAMEPEMDEIGNQRGGRQSVKLKHNPDTPENNEIQRASTQAGKRFSTPGTKINGTANESIVKKANKIFEENKKLKEEISKVTEMLKEAAVTNVNLGGIIKLISENATTMEEKKGIINRFTNDVHTVDESKKLYQTISEELKRKPAATAAITEEKSLGSSKADSINESKFYQDESLMETLGLMHRVCK